MTKKYTPMTVYSVRLAPEAVMALQQRARDQKLPVAMVIRSIINSFLTDQDANDYLAAMEERQAKTIERLSRYQLQTRRVVDISVAQNEYVRQQLDLILTKRQPNEDAKHLLVRSRTAFMEWLSTALTKDGVVKRMIWRVMDQPAESLRKTASEEFTVGEEDVPDV